MNLSKIGNENVLVLSPMDFTNVDTTVKQFEDKTVDILYLPQSFEQVYDKTTVKKRMSISGNFKIKYY